MQKPMKAEGLPIFRVWPPINELAPIKMTAHFAAQGFEWVNEGKDPVAPKWGFTAKLPGSKISFKVSLDATLPPFTPFSYSYFTHDQADLTCSELGV